MGRIAVVQTFPLLTTFPSGEPPNLRQYSVNAQPRPGHPWDISSITFTTVMAPSSPYEWTYTLVFGPTRVTLQIIPINTRDGPQVTTTYNNPFTFEWSDTMLLEVSEATNWALPVNPVKTQFSATMQIMGNVL